MNARAIAKKDLKEASTNKNTKQANKLAKQIKPGATSKINKRTYCIKNASQKPDSHVQNESSLFDWWAAAPN